MNRLRYVFLGATNYSKELLLDLIQNRYIPLAIFAIEKDFTISYSKTKVQNSNYANLKEIALKYNIDYYEVDSSQDKRLQNYEKIIKSLDLNLILVLGWYYMIPKNIRALASDGAWGIHASLLPKYAGGAPLNWAIINGESQTGITLFKLSDGVDDGDIIKQIKFNIEFEDTIKEVYAKATNASKKLLREILQDISNVKFIKQGKAEIYPQRKPADGEIDLTKKATELYNFIRAQSNPYPGAYIKTVDNKKLIIEKARIEDL